MNDRREEADSLGQVEIDKNSYYGSHTQRSLNNFPVSPHKSHQEYIFATVYIKKAAARVNSSLGNLGKKEAKAIEKACDDILNGKLKDQFVLNPYQAGAGTSHNMTVNEVIANRANEILGAPLGSYKFVHPNDHVNMSQSTNDVIPSSIRIASLSTIPKLINTLEKLSETFRHKSKDFSGIIKSGRTHLQDALPVTLGQEFGAYADTVKNDIERIKTSSSRLNTLGIGGTAVGTGINTSPQYPEMMVKELSGLTGLRLIPGKNLFESMQNTADFLDLSSMLLVLSHNLIRIGQDLRLLSSGPGAGFNEINLPEVIPGSSIMPGKVNPSVIEMLIMVCFQVIGFEKAVSLSVMSGQLELNVMLPLIAYDLLEQIRLLTESVTIFDQKCLSGVSANKEMCKFWFERSFGFAAILNPYLGYDKTASLVKESIKTKQNIKDLTIKKGYLSKKQIDTIFDQKRITGPNLK